AKDNARILADTLAGRRSGAYAEAVALNTGALLWIAGRADTLAAGTAEAREALADGRAGERLDHLRALTTED
ncbi:MAG: anthranilate phosphoribosyltransferase, partial [Gammaproteobacteria bacterium]